MVTASPTALPRQTGCLSCEKSYVAFGGAQRVTGAGPHHDEQGGLAFLETGTLRC